VEQDLMISRALVDLFSHPLISSALAFRGGTALYKLHVKPPARYSEDIDLVQITAEPAGRVMEAVMKFSIPGWAGRSASKQKAEWARISSEASRKAQKRIRVTPWLRSLPQSLMTEIRGRRC
jgi:hypothetical protein